MYRYRSISYLSYVILAILVIQFLDGMWLNLFAVFPQVSSSFNAMNMMSFMFNYGPIFMLHMMSGFLLLILGFIILAFSFMSKNSNIVIFSSIGLLAIILAGISGLLFMFSDFSNNIFSYMMSLGFIISIASYTIIIGQRK
ncbi:hypothetical protein [Acidianus brierleyi]|uniref:hypothetical protein n=1 Tax=Acidianus brierleyi TaxID=41673 RepID=UPI0014432D96|nr:hypothetical protein [Acidianus brierleyi]AWR94098.2 hypothetical protein DFR85_05310 [Acidianus brierleyi]